MVGARAEGSDTVAMAPPEARNNLGGHGDILSPDLSGGYREAMQTLLELHT